MFRIKICGVTNREDALAAAAAGADAIGMVCHADSPRLIDSSRAAQICDALPDEVTPVLLFVDAPTQVVEEFSAKVPRAWLQFHNSGASAEFCRAFSRPYIPLCKPAAAVDFESVAVSHPAARAILCDGGSGEGRSFDWELLPPPERRLAPLVLAGGLEPGNVAAAISRIRPSAVDVSSGVCVAGDPRHKDHDLVAAFIAAAKLAEPALA